MTEKQEELSVEEQKRISEELQNHFRNFKKRLKTYSKSELIAMLWEQGVRYRQLQQIAQDMDAELKKLNSGELNEETND